MLNAPVNNFSVMFGRSHRFLCITSIYIYIYIFFFFLGGGGLCLAQGHNTATRVGFEPRVQGVNHQATVPPSGSEDKI